MGSGGSQGSQAGEQTRSSRTAARLSSMHGLLNWACTSLLHRTVWELGGRQAHMQIRHTSTVLSQAGSSINTQSYGSREPLPLDEWGLGLPQQVGSMPFAVAN